MYMRALAAAWPSVVPQAVGQLACGLTIKCATGCGTTSVGKNESVVLRYALRDTTQPMAISTYTYDSLPTGAP